MTHTEAATVVAILHGAYPGTYFDGAVAEVFTNSLLVTEYEPARQAAEEWVASVDRFPTVAELNGAIRRIRQRDRERQLPPETIEKPDRAIARAAFTRGYRQARVKAGDSDPEIDVKLERHLRAWHLDRASESEPLEQTR